MSRFTTIMIVTFGLCWVISPSYGDQMVYYEGSEAGGTSELQYAYRVEVDGLKDSRIMQFRVGSSLADLNIDNYRDVATPEGWQFGVGEGTKPFDVGMTCYNAGPTPIGGTATLLRVPDSSRCALWWTDDPKYAVSSFTFGFNHAGSASNAGWRLVDEVSQPYEETSQVVGLGEGPVRIPTALPEPGTLAILALALLQRRRN